MYSSYINGKWTAMGENFETTSPVTNKPFATVIGCDAEDARAAIKAAKTAFPLWSGLSAEERSHYLIKVAEALEEMVEEIEDILIDEVGSWIGKAKFECLTTPKLFRAAADLAKTVKGYELVSPAGKKSMVVKEPMGVVSVITPWNMPLNLSSRTTSSILAVGNTVILKPAELSPLSGGWVLAKAFEKAGVPKGVFNVLLCSKQNVEKVGDVMVTDPSIKAISFTGSTGVGKHIAAKAGGLLKKVSMELGGKDAMIILDDADLDIAVNAAVFASFNHSGQICMGTKRIYVHEKLTTEFTDRFVAKTKKLGYGDVRDLNKPIAPLINETQIRKIDEQVIDAVAKGATVLAGGKRDGMYYLPTILTGVTSNMSTFDEEAFGPLVSIYVFSTIEEAIDQVNASKYGLSGAVITRDTVKGYEVARKIESGMCHVNDGTIYAEALAPFGGVKNSGIGRYGGQASIDSFTTTKWITIADKGIQYPPAFME
ncbi:aldehyde dehydrogenase (NAD+) [Zobellia uliginosa]|uniref:Aldehyde dehydrogenase (NAD+) n=1 Tax=Zobellia uliginosa TaxID=143224 RepID=A0ABY1KK10_9FLAO|nr:aldehyde dehydrogenase family protein [Zobellia uliginosa]SIS43339.1 aldehyde dehydrogenase (NAD+) [Zobellia uliginosa]